MGERRRVGGVLGVASLALLVLLVTAAPAPAAHRASGSLLFSWRYADATGQASMRELCVAPDGAVYAAGATSSNGMDDSDVLVVRFAGGTTPVWTRTWDSGVGGAYAWDAAVDRSGNVVVGGMTATATSAGDWVVLKYSPEGEPLWAHTVAGETASNDWLYAVACDRAGNVFAAGSLQDATGNNCFAVVKFAAADGSELWRRVVPGLDPAWHDDKAQDVVVDGAGNAYATGVSYNADHTLHRCMTLKLTPGGDVGWRRIIQPKGLDRYGYYLARVGSSLYVQLYGNLADDTSPLHLAKYTTGGRRVWLRTFPIRRVASVYPWDMTANITGAVVAADADSGGLVAKVTPGGRLAWSRRYARSQTGLTRRFHAVCMDGDGRVWAAGQALIPVGESQTADWLVQRFGPTGRVAWTKTLGGLEGGYDDAGAIALSGTSSLWVSGGLAHADGSIADPSVARYRR